MQELLLKYGDDCISSLKLNIGKVKKSFNARAIHSLRLSVKKINALFSFFEILEISVISKKLLKKINLLFFISGMLRDIQIQISLAKKFKQSFSRDSESLTSYLVKKRRKAEKKLKKQLAKTKIDDLDRIKDRIKSGLVAFDENTLKTLSIEFTNRTLILIQQLISKKHDDENLHQIRICLKMFIYTLTLLIKDKEAIMVDKSAVKSLNAIQQAIGDWHDYDLLFNRVNRLYQKKGEYQNLLPLIESSKDQLKKKIYQQLDELVNLKIDTKAPGIPVK